MEQVKVKAISTHHGRYGTIMAGQEYKTDKPHAAELKRNGLVEFDGDAAPMEKGENILHASDKPKEKEETLKTLEKVELKPGHLPTAKKTK